MKKKIHGLEVSGIEALAKTAFCEKRATSFLEQDFVNGERQIDGCLGCMQIFGQHIFLFLM